jgi:hypothetical protein
MFTRHLGIRRKQQQMSSTRNKEENSNNNINFSLPFYTVKIMKKKNLEWASASCGIRVVCIKILLSSVALK